MTQVNLLPEVKLQFVRAQRVKRITVSIGILAAGVALFILIIMLLVVDVFQKKYLHDINNDIGTYTNQIKATPDLNKVLTVQNQLNNLTSLHNQKPVTSRLFDYLGKVVPANVTISNLTVDFDQHTMAFTGNADTLSTVNTFTDTLKFTTYSLTNSSSQKTAFSSVVLTTFSRSDTGATYTINLSFDPAIFNGTQSPSLSVPANKITTRSETEQPTALFQTNATSQ